MDKYTMVVIIALISLAISIAIMFFVIKFAVIEGVGKELKKTNIMLSAFLSSQNIDADAEFKKAEKIEKIRKEYKILQNQLSDNIGNREEVGAKMKELNKEFQSLKNKEV